MKKSAVYIFLFLIVVSGCEKAAVIQSKDFPFIVTRGVTEITDSSLVFNCEILSEGLSEIVEFGFLWDITEPDIESSNKAVMPANASVGEYSKKIDFGLFKDKVQFVRAYLKTADNIVYGNIIKFRCNGGKQPVIINFTPGAAYVNTEVKIRGLNFGTTKKNVRLLFGNVEALVESCTDTLILARVPAINIDSEFKIRVEVYNKPVESTESFKAYTYWRKVADMPGPKRYGAVSFTINGKGYVCTGKTYGGEYFADLYEYDPGLNSWTKKADFPGIPRAFGAGYSENGKGYFGFGFGNNSYFHDFWEYDPQLDTWTKVFNHDAIYTYHDAYFFVNNVFYIFSQSNTWTYSDTLIQSWNTLGFPGEYRFFTTGVSCQGLGYIIAGQKPGNALLKDFWCYNPTIQTWYSKADFPGQYRDGVAAFSLNDKLYAGLGGSYGGDFLDFYEYTPSSDSWTRIEDFRGDKREMPVSFEIGSKAYVGTGRNSSMEGLNDFWEFDPNKL